jgi:hypothetical protein
MDPQNRPCPKVRHDGWTPERKRRFLESLAEKDDVRRACARVELSRQAAYELRRRDALFAEAWTLALRLGRRAAAAEGYAVRAVPKA